MKLQLDRLHIHALSDRFPGLRSLREQLQFGHRVELSSHVLPLEALTMLAELFDEAGTEMAGRAAQLRGLVRALERPSHRFGEGDPLEAVLPALVRHLLDEQDDQPARGWLYAANVDGKPLAWVPTRLDFVMGSSEELAKIMMELKAQAKAQIVSHSLRITEADLKGRTLPEILASKGFLRETAELNAAYDASVQAYVDRRARYGGQFIGTGMGFHAEDPTATHRDHDWTRKDQVVLHSASSGGGGARA